MKFLLPIVLVVMQAFVVPLVAQSDSGTIQIGRSHYLEGLRREVQELQQKVFEEEQRFSRLMRLKVHWDLLLPVRNEDLFEGSKVPSKSAADLASELAAEIRREVGLKARFRRTGGFDSDRPLPRIKDLDLLPPPAPGAVATKARDTETLPPLDDSTDREPAAVTTPAVAHRNFGPMRSTPTRPGPSLARSEALTPFGGGEKLTLFAPSAFLAKRVRALIGAGMATEALAVLGVRLDSLKEAKQDPEPSLLYLKAKTLESLRELEKAKEIYAQVTDIDRGTNAEGKDVFGIWAKSANFALEHLRWLETNSDYTPPDIEELK